MADVNVTIASADDETLARLAATLELLFGHIAYASVVARRP